MGQLGKLERAISAAIEFLINQRQDSGWWKDFEIAAGLSDEWVSAYVACSLGKSDEPKALKISSQTLDLYLESRKHEDGWGFNRRTPPDADSTIWVCRLVLLWGQSPELYERGLAFLRRCLRGTGGVATYPDAESIRPFVHLGDDAPFRGWCGPQLCVTAAAALLPEIGACGALRDYVRGAQKPGGFWRGYWWSDSEYPTLLAVQALSCWNADEDCGRLLGAARWAESDVKSDSAFGAACRVGIVAAVDPEHAACLAKKLIAMQNADGSWNASARLRIPSPDCMEPDRRWYWSSTRHGMNTVQTDQWRLFTTATALSALLEIR